MHLELNREEPSSSRGSEPFGFLGSTKLYIFAFPGCIGLAGMPKREWRAVFKQMIEDRQRDCSGKDQWGQVKGGSYSFRRCTSSQETAEFRREPAVFRTVVPAIGNGVQVQSFVGLQFCIDHTGRHPGPPHRLMGCISMPFGGRARIGQLAGGCSTGWLSMGIQDGSWFEGGQKKQGSCIWFASAWGRGRHTTPNGVRGHLDSGFVPQTLWRHGRTDAGLKILVACKQLPVGAPLLRAEVGQSCADVCVCVLRCPVDVESTPASHSYMRNL